MPSIWLCQNSCRASSPTMPAGSKENLMDGLGSMMRIKIGLPRLRPGSGLRSRLPWLSTHLGCMPGFGGSQTSCSLKQSFWTATRNSLNRAVARLIAKRRPSHKKEIKDSMNMEQSLELCSQLRNSGFTHPAVFISSNTNDYAAAATSSQLHNDLQAEFAAVSLEYFPSLRAAFGSLRARGVLP